MIEIRKFDTSIIKIFLISLIVSLCLMADILLAGAKEDALFDAVEAGDEQKVIQAIKDGADVNVKNDYSYTPLFYAAEEGNKEIVELLIYNGADVNIVDNSGWTAFYHAMKKGKNEIAELLKKSGDKYAQYYRFIDRERPYVFGFVDETRKRLITLRDMEIGKPEKLIKAIYAGNNMYQIKYIRYQKKTEEDTGRDTAYNFANFGGYVFEIISNRVGDDDTCLLVDKDFFVSRKILNLTPIDSEKCDATVIKKIEDLKKRKVADNWGIVKTDNNIKFYEVLFEKEGNNALKSVVMVAPDRLVFKDYPAKYNEITTWRADDGGSTYPGEFRIILVSEVNNRTEFILLWGAFEGQDISVLYENIDIFSTFVRYYRHWAPF